MNSCIYCNRNSTSTKLSESHVIPDALSNGTMKNYSVCIKHNNTLSDAFESKIINELGIISNNLDIKSSNSKDFQKYTVLYEWRGKKFIDSRHTSLNAELDKILTSEDKSVKIGPDYLVNTDKIYPIKYGDSEIKAFYPINIDIFNSLEMKRLISKIAYEWFCSFNKINYMPNFSQDIRDFILGISNINKVNVINNSEIRTAFKNIGEEYSHKLIAYLNSNNNYCIMISFWDIIIYEVEICSLVDFPNGIKLFYREQIIDSSHNPFFKNTLEDYYEHFEKVIMSLYSSTDIFEEKMLSNMLNLKALNSSEQTKEFHFQQNLIYLYNTCKDYLPAKNDFSSYKPILEKELNTILTSTVVTLKKVKRVVNAITLYDNSMDITKLNLKHYPLIYLLYRLGKEPIERFENLEFNSYTNRVLPRIINLSIINQLFKEIDNDPNAIMYIKKGSSYFS